MTYCLKRKNKKRFFSFQSMPNLNFAELILYEKRRIDMFRKCMWLMCGMGLCGLLAGQAVAAGQEPLVYYPFDQLGPLVVDASGNGHDGTPNGALVLGEGYVERCFQFNGNDTYVELARPIQDDFTLVAWIRTEAPGHEEGTSAFHGSGLFYADVGGSANDFVVAVLGTKLSFNVGNPNTTVTSSGDVVTGEWVHVAAVRDITAGTISLFVNGTLDGRLNHSNRESLSANPMLFIGANIRDTRYYTGLIDDIRMYDHILSEVEILGAMAGKIWPYALGPVPADGALHPDTWVNLSWTPGRLAVSHDVYLGENFDDVNAGAEGTFVGNQTDTFIVAGFPGFAFPDGLVPGTTYYWRIDEVNDTEPNSPWKGDVWSLSIPPKTAYFPDPAVGAEQVYREKQLSWTEGFGSKLHTVYFGDNFDDVNNATGGLPQADTTYDPGPLELAKTYYWRADEFDLINTYKGNVWSFTTEGAVAALDPVNGAVDVTQTPVLTWAPGLGATHEVYFGTDAASLELKSSGNLGSESYEPGQLEWNTTYYWRVDEANNANADSPWTGPLWSFTTANFLIIDDMESYNDIDEGETGSNRIYVAWVDGFDDPTNGSQVGHLDPPFYEETIVHSGNKSMPMYYDNAVGKSEATLTLTDKRDWTVNGVDTLTIWFRGSTGNIAEAMYVTLNGSASVDNDNPDAAQAYGWTEWNTPLQAFAGQGVNLANVTSITIGLRSVTGGTGMMYFDDIRLYPSEP